MSTDQIVLRHIGGAERTVDFLGVFGEPPRPHINWGNAGMYAIDMDTGRLLGGRDLDAESPPPLDWVVKDDAALQAALRADWQRERERIVDEAPGGQKLLRELDEVLSPSPRSKKPRRWTVIQGDCLEMLRLIPDNSIDHVNTDTPYNLTGASRKGSPRKANPNSPFGRHAIGQRGFMNKVWDGTGIAFRVELWREVKRVMKPGAQLFAFGSTRTSHRLACAIEDAGFEMKDTQIMLFATGYPKSLNVSKNIDEADGVADQREVIHSYTAGGNAGTSTKDKGGTFVVGAENSPPITLTIERGATEKSREWDGYGTAVKPAYEPVVWAQKPREGRVIDNVLKWRTGAINIDGCRVPTNWDDGSRGESWFQSGHSAEPEADKIAAPPGQGIQCHPLGYFPPNVHWVHTEDCTESECVPDCAVALLNAQAGERKSGTGTVKRESAVHDGSAYGKENSPAGQPQLAYGGSGPASRFFPCFRYIVKPSRAERELGCDALPAVSGASAVDREEGTAGVKNPRAGAGRTASQVRNRHPTVKSVDYLRYLCRMACPPKGIVLDIFCGSGSSGVASLLEGYRYIGIDLNDSAEEPYCTIARARCQSAIDNPGAWMTEKRPTPESKKKKKPTGQQRLF